MIYQKITSFIEKNIIFIILFSYLLFMFGFYFGSDYFFIREIKLGYLLGGDSKRYIHGAEKILNLEIPERKATLDIFYIFLYLNTLI